MSSINYKRGNITIILVVFLCFSFGVLALAKFIDISQASVTTAVDSRFQNPTIALSVSMDPPSKWEKYENTPYNYSIKYPKQWPASKSQTQNGDLNTYSRFLSNRVKLKVSVSGKYDKPQDAQQTTIGKNTYFFSKNQENLRSATTEHNKKFYTVELSQDNYFADTKEFNAVFLNILKNFDSLK